MEIRPLRPGEEADWVRLTCNDESFEAKVAGLSAYRQSNPQLHPCSYLVMLDGKRFVASLRTYSEDPTSYNLSKIVVDPTWSYGDVGLALLKHAIPLFADRPLEAMSWDQNEDECWHQLLSSAGFYVYIEKHYVHRDLAGYCSPYRDPFTYQSLAEVGEAEFLEQFARIYPGNLNRNFNNDDPRAEFFELKNSAGSTFDERQWRIAYLKGGAAGILIPKIFDDLPDEGTIHTFGLFPEFRGKGLGRILHAIGLQELSRSGASKYIGSTDVFNLPMRAIFKANGCTVRGVRRQFRLLSVDDLVLI